MNSVVNSIAANCRNTLVYFLLGTALLLTAQTAFAEQFDSEEYQLELTQLTDGLNHPWGMAVLPGGDILVTEREGGVRLWRQSSGLSDELQGLPAIARGGQGGLLDIALHPDFAENSRLYLSYSKKLKGGKTTAVATATLDTEKLAMLDTREIFAAQPAQSTSHHFGSRLLFGADGLLYISVGDRGKRPMAQDPSNHMGTIVRIKDDGGVPSSNPFVGKSGYRPEIFSYGHRNPQGMALFGDSVWIHEHGPRGGDEINLPQAGKNYGWPIITHGKAYSGFSIGEGTSKPGLEQPLWHWTPSIAPSGMVIYQGEMFARWQGNSLVGSLKFSYLERLVWKDGKVSTREKLLERAIGRVRDVREGPNGELYLLNDQSNGGIYRLTRAEST